MSRTESTPATSPLSITMRWRKPPCAIAAAASSSDHSGVAKTSCEVRCAATSSVSGFSPAPTDRRMSRSVMIPGPGASGSWTTAAPTLRCAIWVAQSRSVWPGPTVRTVALIPSLTRM